METERLSGLKLGHPPVTCGRKVRIRTASLRPPVGYAPKVVDRTVIAIALVLALAACSEAREATTTTGVPTTSSSAPSEVSVDSGRLVVIEADGSVAVIEPDGSGRTPLSEGQDDVAFTQPIWSPDSSRIAYGQISEDGFAVRIDDVGGAGGSVSIPVSNNPFFMHWSPDGESMGVLHNGSQGLDFELVDVSAGTISVVDSGSPFYFSWSPSSDRVVVHEGLGRFETVDLQGARTSLGETDGSYLVPQWLPQGILHVVDGRLVLEGDEPDVLAEVGEQTMFVANRQGSLVAVQTIGAPEQTVSLAQTGTLQTNVVAVVDLATGQVEVVDGDPVVGLWWSPAGDSLLLLTPISGGSALMAKVWSSDDGLVEYSRYRPSPIQARDLLPFFPQYAQSMTFWAPDSSGFALAGEVGGESGIWVHQIGVLEPMKVSDGLWVSWSSH